MKRFLSILFVLSIVTLSQGCTFVHSDVAVFHRLSKTETPHKYSFVPLEWQEGSLEYSKYQELIRSQLGVNNYQEVDIPDANVIVTFSYGIDNGREEISSVPVYGQTGVSSSTTYGSVNTYGNQATYSGTTTYTPTYGIVGSSTVSHTKYGRHLLLYISKNKNVETDKSERLYEGSVKSNGSSSQLSSVMPAMIKALFKEFPGESGSTRSEKMLLH